MYRAKPILQKESFFGAAPNIFVGKFGYPDVNVGIMSPTENLEEAKLCDDPMTWTKDGFDINQVINQRARLVNSRVKANIKDNTKITSIAKETAMSLNPVDMEVNLSKRPTFSMNFEQIAVPMGSNAKLKKATITENVKVKRKVDKVVDDTALKSVEAVSYLDKHNFNEYFLTKLLSSGNLGLEENRKMVPTRWAITATDDIISKEQLKEIKHHKLVNDYQVYFNNNIGNYYVVLLIPASFSYELFETYLPKSIWNDNNLATIGTDYEPFEGRKDYAKNCTGGYYASKIAITKKLQEMKRQASVLTLRFITDEYFAPLGVWNCRETTKKALESNPVKFDSLELALKYIFAVIKKKFSYDVNILYDASKLLKNIVTQEKLTKYN